MDDGEPEAYHNARAMCHTLEALRAFTTFIVSPRR